MTGLRVLGLLLGLLPAAGCVSAPLGPTQLPKAPPPSADIGTLTRHVQDDVRANTAAAARVHQIGRKLLHANPELRLAPQFAVRGQSGVEIVRRGEGMIEVTQGLTARCDRDELLAGVLALELARAVAEREAREQALLAGPGREPPMEIAIGPDNAAFGDPGPMRMAELHRGGFIRRPAAHAPTAVSDPHLLAMRILRNAGYPESAAADAASLLRDAER